MKFCRLLTLLLFLAFTQSSFAQNAFKVGPSALINVGIFNEEITKPLGIEMGYEIGMGERFSLNLAGTVHYGEFENKFLENRVNEIKQKDLYIGSQADIRYHFNQRFKGAYLGIGTDIKHLTSKNYFIVTTEDPIPTLVNVEFNAGISYGFYISLPSGYLNPNIYIGGNPTDQNENELHAKLGLNYVF